MKKGEDGKMERLVECMEPFEDDAVAACLKALLEMEVTK
jgi:hypothetical protein